MNLKKPSVTEMAMHKMYDELKSPYKVAEQFHVDSDEVMHAVAHCLQYKRWMADDHYLKCETCPWGQSGRPCVWPKAICLMKEEE